MRSRWILVALVIALPALWFFAPSALAQATDSEAGAVPARTRPRQAFSRPWSCVEGGRPPGVTAVPAPRLVLRRPAPLP